LNVFHRDHGPDDLIEHFGKRLVDQDIAGSAHRRSTPGYREDRMLAAVNDRGAFPSDDRDDLPRVPGSGRPRYMETA